MRQIVSAVVDVVRAALKPRSELVIENLALRQQLAVLTEKSPRPKLTNSDRAFWVLLRRLWPRWSDALVIVQPETVVRWPSSTAEVFAFRGLGTGHRVVR